VNFLENKSRSEQNEYSAVSNSSWGISERNMREINFSSMCHIFYFMISCGLRGQFSLKSLSEAEEALNIDYVSVSGKDGKQFLVNFYRYWNCLAFFSSYI